MITARALRSKFADLEGFIPFVSQRVKETLVSFAEPLGFAVLVREKKLESLSEKLETGRFSCWSEIDDVIASTIVVPSYAEEERILTFLRDAFLEVRTTKRGATKKQPEVFRFDCTRFIGKLNLNATVPSTEPVYQIMFEVQIRTAFEHAWSVTTHGLTYKNDQVDWKRMRLAAQLKASVEQLDMLVAGFGSNANLIQRSAWPEIDAKEAIANFFQGLLLANSFPQELAPKDWTRFADNVFALLCSSPSLRRLSPLEKVQRASNCFSDFLSDERSLPTSLSLAQTVFVALFTRGVIVPPLERFTPLITEEMETLFPAVAKLTKRFNFELRDEAVGVSWGSGTGGQSEMAVGDAGSTSNTTP